MRLTEFARRVKQLRTERDMSVRALANEVGKSPAYLAKIEVQGEVPSPDLTLQLAEALAADPVELMRLAKEARLSTITRQIERQYDRWLRTWDERSEEGKSPMSRVVSLINMKGGVGKSTLTMQLAHSAASRGFRTLAVDLDPQSNLSQAMMTPRNYVQHIGANLPTVVQIFDEYVPSGPIAASPKLLNVEDVIVQGVGYKKKGLLDLIPSRLELSRTLKNPAGKERRLAKSLAKISESYDLVLIDCAPTESILTDAAYFASRYVVVPIKPEFMATIGLPLLARSLTDFQLENEDHTIEIAGIAFNHSATYSSGPEGMQSINEVTREAAQHGWHIFENQVRYSASYAKSAREGASLSQTSYARWDVIQGFSRFADEVFDRIGLVTVPA
ncbi:MAG TPA: AAA family ATPase [Allosphingosinicella sp.]|jgi:chromosome partitioning protein